MSRELVAAIRAGNLSRVKALIERGADPNFRLPEESDHGWFLHQVTPLMVAAAAPKANAEIVEYLLESGADLTAVSAGGVSATWYACGGGTGKPLTESNLSDLDSSDALIHWGGGDVARLKLLLDAGGNPNESADNGRSCVFEACSVGDPSRLRLLIERGAAVGPSCPAESIPFPGPSMVSESAKHSKLGFDFSLTFQQIPLFKACESGSLECVKLIVGAGFPADFALDRRNALNYSSTPEIFDYLRQLGVRFPSGSSASDPIDDAIRDDRIPVLESLLAKVDAHTIQRKLCIASGALMNPNAVRLLIQFGANPQLTDQDYGTALHAACWQCDTYGGRETRVVRETIEALIEAGADVNLMVRGLRPIHEAVHGDGGSPTALRVLLQHGADVDSRTEDGMTALMIAAGAGEVECVRLLLQAGANRSLRQDLFRDARYYARSYGKPSLIGSFVAKRVFKRLGWSDDYVKGIEERMKKDAREIRALLDQ